MKALVYARYSDSGRGRSESAAAQVAKCEQYCEFRSLRVAGTYSDEEVSGGDEFATRPEGARLLTQLRRPSPRIDAVVVAKLDRGWRRVVDCLTTVEAWQTQGVALHVVDLGGNAIDTSTAAGKFMLTVLAAAAEMERGTITERTSQAMRYYQAKGRRMSAVSRIPYGWAIDPAGPTIVGRDGKTRLANLVAVEAEQDAIRQILELRAAGETYRAIRDALTEAGTACRGGPWHFSTVRAIIKREGARGA